MFPLISRLIQATMQPNKFSCNAGITKEIWWNLEETNLYKYKSY